MRTGWSYGGRGRHGIGRRLRLLAAVTLVALTVLALSGLAGPADSDPHRLPVATLSLTPSAAPVTVPRSFLGLSTEYWALPLYARHLATFERVLDLIHVPGDGPMVLRVGGDSADHSFWDPRRHTLPSWTFTLTPQWTDMMAGIVRRLGVRLILDLNLITDTPDQAALWAAAAQARLPPRSIIGFEIGNEPDLYTHRGWMRLTAGDLLAGQTLPHALTVGDYLRDFRAYAGELRSVAPRLTLIGPALAEPRAHGRWVRALLRAHPAGLRMISVHRYPYSGCVSRRSRSWPTIARLLSRHATTSLAAGLEPMIAATHRAGLPFRLTELNSVTCGGRRGVSDSFATALWAPDTLFALLRARVNGVNLHVRAHTINAPFAFTRRGLFARPLLYGLVLFSRALDGAVATAPSRLHVASSLNVDAWALRTRTGGLHLLAINKGARDVRLVARVPGAASAQVQRLTAAGPRSRFGVSLGGQRIGVRGIWRGRFHAEWVRRRRHAYAIVLPRYSAALIRIAPVAGAAPLPLAARRQRPS